MNMYSCVIADGSWVLKNIYEPFVKGNCVGSMASAEMEFGCKILGPGALWPTKQLSQEFAKSLGLNDMFSSKDFVGSGFWGGIRRTDFRFSNVFQNYKTVSEVRETVLDSLSKVFTESLATTKSYESDHGLSDRFYCGDYVPLTVVSFGNTLEFLSMAMIYSYSKISLS